MAFISWHFVLVKRSITSDCGANERYINTENVVIISVSKSITFNLMTLSVCGEVWYWISRLINEQLVSMLGWGVCASIKTSIYLSLISWLVWLMGDVIIINHSNFSISWSKLVGTLLRSMERTSTRATNAVCLIQLLLVIYWSVRPLIINMGKLYFN